MLKQVLKLFLVVMASKAIAFEVSSEGVCTIEGVDYPAVGFGTYPYTNEVCERAVEHAAGFGYRIFDTATFYQNFKPIGRALNRSGRENYYIISKVWPDSQTPELLNKDLQETLKRLNINYIDAYLLHWPNSKIPIEETLPTVVELKNKGLIRHIGLANVTVNHLKRVMELNIPISWVQVEMNPHFYDPALIDFCKEHSITIQAWAPLGRGRLSKDSMLTRIGQKYGKTASQVAIKWIVQHGCLPLPGSKNIDHIRENLDISDFTLAKEDMEEIDQRAKLGKRERFYLDEFDFTYEECWPKNNPKFKKLYVKKDNQSS